MSRTGLIGTRIRETRLRKELRQSDLARRAGISASYLNLIEHNRRRPGAALLDRIAAVLAVPAVTLSEGGRDPIFDGLREAAADGAEVAPAELERIEEFAGRFPGWAELVVAQRTRLLQLERTVERLTDRMMHDPYLSTALHEVLSAVSAVRSTAAILSETEDIDPAWQRKFHANLHDDSVRLAEGAQALVGYLDAAGVEESGLAAPQEELEAWLTARNYHLPELEADDPPEAQALISDVPELATRPARTLARRFIERYRDDAHAMPVRDVLDAVARQGPDPARIAHEFGVSVGRMLRRLAMLPPQPGTPDAGPGQQVLAAAGLDRTGLVVCDASGTLVLRKPVEGFALPRFGAACPLWPLYDALGDPGRPLARRVEMAGRLPRRFMTYSVCEQVVPPQFNAPMIVEATMLIAPAPDPPERPAAGPGHGAGTDARPIGTSCRICPRRVCPARREPSILAEEF